MIQPNSMIFHNQNPVVLVAWFQPHPCIATKTPELFDECYFDISTFTAHTKFNAHQTFGTGGLVVFALEATAPIACNHYFANL